MLYSSFREQNVYEIYSLDLNDGSVDQLTDRLGVLTAPEVSPDGNVHYFRARKSQQRQYQIMVMDRNGENAGNIPQIAGWDPTWSPDGKQILFASGPKGGCSYLSSTRMAEICIRFPTCPPSAAAVTGQRMDSPSSRIRVRRGTVKSIS